jgi:Rps23 Pro-64 3,4-dihydroxylase Tpa1-like proline 4-hydroxylase
MDLKFYRVKNLSYFVVDGFFTERELVEVIKEIDDLKRFALPPEKTRSAVKDGALQKTGTGVFLDGIYKGNRTASPILQGNRRLFCNEITRPAEEFDVVFTFLEKSNSDSTLLNYYVEGQEYRAHSDNTRISAVTFLQQGRITGGEFCFPEQNVVIEAKHNRTVVFPSCATHKAMPVQGAGTRVSIAQFVDKVENT